MKKLLTLLLFLSLLFPVNQARAQSRFAVTLQGGYGTGAYEATHTGISTGSFALRANVSYAVLPVLDAYVAYSRNSFTCGPNAGGFCRDEQVNFTSSGFNLGLRLNRGPEASIWVPWLRAGIVYQTLKWDAGINSYSESGLGFEIGAGLAYPLTEQIKIVPSVNYTRYSIKGANGVKNSVVTVSYLIGARYEF